MTPRLPKVLPAAVLIGLVLTLTAGITPAQQPLPPLPPPGAAQPAQPDPNAGDPNAPEVLARGPVHEAFAATVEAPVAGPIVAKQPPEPIEELPPDEKPSGDNVQWISGYWSWDDDADRYIWISGFWRVSPPGRIWVPGSWREARGGYQWAPGFWQEPPPQQVQQAVQQQPEIQYLPPPPASIEVGPTAPAVTTTSFYTPGSWVWRGRFVWRPGFWIEHRPNWVWVPAHYRWSPVGYVFIDGYWDYPLANRGVLYAPMYFPQAVYAQPAFVYTPAYVVSDQAMMGAMFIRRGYGSYYFGDYYAPRYATGGFTAWCGTIGAGGGFALGFGVGRAWGYDPLWSYYSFNHRQNPAWSAGVTSLYSGRYNGTVARPPVNLVQQNTVINKITNVTNVNTNVTNVTNNITVVNKHVTVNNHNVTDVAMLAPAKVAKDLHPEAKIQPISAEVRKTEAVQANLTRDVGVQRRKVETAAVAQRPMPKATDPPAKAIDQPQTLKLDVPKAIVAKAHVIDETKPPPANPHKDPKAALKVDPKIDHQPDPHPIFTPKVDPKVNPKVDPKIGPKVEPLPKFEPKVNPKVEPQPKVEPLPKFEPKVPVLPKVEPKVDPKQPVLPKVEPKVPMLPNPNPNPKLEPLPKVEPKGPVPPKVEPKGEPKFEPKQPPKVEPKFSTNVPSAEANQPIRVQPLATIPNPMVPVHPVGQLPMGQLPHGNLPMVNNPQAPQPRHGAPGSATHKKD